MPLVLRSTKGSALNVAEFDGNFTYLATVSAGKADATDARLTDARTPLAHTHSTAESWLINLLDTKAAASSVSAITAALDGKVDDDDTRLTDLRGIAPGDYGLFTVTSGTASLGTAAGAALISAISSVPAEQFRAFAGALTRATASDAPVPSVFHWTGDGDLGGEWRQTEDLDFATKEEIWQRATGRKVVTVEAWRDANAPVPLSVSGAVALDLNTGINFDITVTGAMTFNIPTGIEATKEGVIRFFGTGAHAITLGSSSNLLNKSAITFQSGAGAETHVYYRCRGATQVELGMMWSKAA